MSRSRSCHGKSRLCHENVISTVILRAVKFFRKNYKNNEFISSPRFKRETTFTCVKIMGIQLGLHWSVACLYFDAFNCKM